MFEESISGNKISKEEFQLASKELRENLLGVQRELLKSDFQMVNVLSGVDRIGRQRVLNRLHEWLDPRYLHTRVFQLKYKPEQLEGMFFERFWKGLPEDGLIGVFLRGWYANIIAEWLDIKDEKVLQQRIKTIRNYEANLADDGVLFLKFWLHKPKDVLKKEIKKAEKDPDGHWWLSSFDKELYQRYDEVVEVAEHILAQTNTLEAPWKIVESSNERFRDLYIGREIHRALRERLDRPPLAAQLPEVVDHALASDRQERNILDGLDLSQSLEREEYKDRLHKLLAEMHQLSYKTYKRGIAQVFAFEGWDAAGKGGCIRRLVLGLDANQYRIYPVAAPTDYEKKFHYLWRFWNKMPPKGKISIFDRTWYGRVLVERIEGFASEVDWKRAYNEINHFEEQMADSDFIIHKFWIHIDPDEQMRRFKEREKTPYKQFKITEEDYRNREKWDEYAWAVHDMVINTSTPYAKWVLVPGNDKKFARITVLEESVKRIKEHLKGHKD